MSSLWMSRAFRPALRYYPFSRGKGRLINILCADPSILPDGDVVSTKTGIRVRLKADSLYRRIFLFGEYEATTSRFFSRFCRPGDIAVDAGANFGWFSLLMRKYIEPGGIVHAFDQVFRRARQ